MRRFIFLAFLAAVIVGCGKSEPPQTVESLAANPERLKELQEQCKIDRAKLGDELCNRVAEATNRLFFGDGKVPHTPSKDPPKF